MRTAIKKTDVYKFEELPEEGKENAIQNLYDINVDYDGWYEDDYLLEPKDYTGTDGKPMFSWKQIYFDLDRNNYVQFIDLVVNDENSFRELLNITPEVWEELNYGFENGNYRWNTPNTKLILEYVGEGEFTPEGWKQIDEIIENAQDIFADLVGNALNNLNKNYEYLTSEEAIIETIKANEYEFTADGKLY
jgi:hypothetical protein